MRRLRRARADGSGHAGGRRLRDRLAANDYACRHVGGVTHILRPSLQALEKELDEKTFVRIHRSIIVNVDKVRGLEPHGSGEYEVVLPSQIRRPLSRRFRRHFRDRM